MNLVKNTPIKKILKVKQYTITRNSLNAMFNHFFKKNQ